MSMTEERKKVINSICISFLTGTILGIILFFAQLKSGAENVVFEIKKNISTGDFFRVAWMNMLWMISVFIARCILPVRYMHPIILLHGIKIGFSSTCMIKLSGAVNAAVVIIPQVLTFTIMLTVYTIRLIEKRKKAVVDMKEPNVLKGRDVFEIMFFSATAAGAEIILFKLIVRCLF